MSKKIFRSIWLAALIVLVLSLVLIMGVLYSYFTGVQQKQLRTGAEVVAQGVTLDGKEFFDGLTAEDYRITWIDADGTVLYDNQSDASSMENHLMREEVQQALQNGTGESSRYSDTLASRNLYCARLLPDGTIIRLSAAQHSVWVLLVGFAQPICVILLLALVLSFLLASRLSRTIVEPINSLNLDEPSQYVGREEYAEIEPLLRRMALQQAQIRQDQDKLEKSSQIRQEFTANVSHELKTPLHAISGYAELMENGMVQQQDIKPFAHKIRQESLRLTALVEDIINLTKLDGGAAGMQRQQVDLYRIAENAVDSIQAAAAEAHVDLTLRGESAFVDGIPQGWERMVLSEVTSVLKRGISPKYSDNGKYSVINQKCIRSSIMDISESRRQEKEYAPTLNLQDSDTVICSTGTGTLGRVGRVYGDYPNTTFDSHVTLVRAKENPNYIYHVVKSQQEYLMGMGRGSTNQQELYRDVIERLVVLCPSQDILLKADRVLNAIHCKIKAVYLQNNLLVESRDRLLPKLMSGEIEV